MLGRMQHHALTVDRFLTHAARWHGDVQSCEFDCNGQRRTSTYAQIHHQARRMSAALAQAGIVPGDRVATLAMNHLRHLEAWYGIMSMGAICHTVNPRLFVDQLVYIVNHAGSRILLADASFAELAAKLAQACDSIERVILFPDGSDPGCFAMESYDRWLDSATGEAPAWGDLDENSAAGLCYTSGTTGNPKGVLYSHRSQYLHALMTLQHDALGLSASDVVLPVVPMFHANSWGIAFSAPAAGSRLVMPGARLDGASMHELIEKEGVTFAAGVPTVWQGLLQHVADNGASLRTLKRVLIGGSACPPSMIRAFEDGHGVEVIHAWGMTETSPVASLAVSTAAVATMNPGERHLQACKQGRPLFGIEVSLADDHGQPVEHDGSTPGHLLVRGPTVAAGYFKDDQDATDAHGWFDTGDVATIDRHGYIQITDRAKDLIKSGGEWISSIEIENIVMGAPYIECAAVVATPDDRWGERPLLLVQPKAGSTVELESLRTLLEGKIPRWWMPDEIRTVESIPLGATGKIDKKRIRAELAEQRA